MAKEQIPLKEILPAIDKKDRGWYDRLSPERKKSFNAWLLLRYVSTVQGKHDKHYLYFTNLMVNEHFAEISKHPELQWLLLTAVGKGKVETHNYLKPPTARKRKDKVSEFLYSQYPLAKRDEIELMLKLNSKDDLKEMARSTGMDAKQIKEIFK